MRKTGSFDSQVDIINNNVNYRKVALKRPLLMDMRRTLLEKCEEIIDSMQWPFGVNNLRTEKIFNDLL